MPVLLTKGFFVILQKGTTDSALFYIEFEFHTMKSVTTMSSLFYLTYCTHMKTFLPRLMWLSQWK